MLRIIILSLFWALCSTCLIRPWFWKRIKNKNLFDEYGKPSFEENDIKFEIGYAIFVLVMSLVMYMGFSTRTNIYGSYLMIILIFIKHLLYDNQNKKVKVVCGIVILISIGLWIQDGIAGYIVSDPLKKIESVPIASADENGLVKPFFSSEDIKNLFQVETASGPTYNNGRYIFEVSDKSDDGVVVIDVDEYSVAKYIPCEYEFSLKEIRKYCPTEKIKETYITISDDNIPYGLFSIADKKWTGGYEIEKYALFNLQTGEIQEYELDELPKFVTNS